MNYDVDYFIAKLEAIPDDKWCVGVLVNDAGQRCAMGHCAVGAGEEPALWMLLPTHGCGKTRIAAINDGDDPRYQQPTPKARILAALRDIKAKAAA